MVYSRVAGCLLTGDQCALNGSELVLDDGVTASLRELLGRNLHRGIDLCWEYVLDTPMNNAQDFIAQQNKRNRELLDETPFVGAEITAAVLDFSLDIEASSLDQGKLAFLQAFEKKSAQVALKSLASLAKINELDHLGGGLDLIPALAMTQALCEGQEHWAYTIEHAHTSIGYYATLATWGYLEEARVVDHFRRSLDIAGHVSWVPGGTQLNGGRLGVMVPTAVGQALGLKAQTRQRSVRGLSLR